MNARAWLTVASFAVALTVAAIVLLAVPARAWEIESVVSLVLLAAAVVQTSMVRHAPIVRGDDGPRMASLGTSGLLTLSLLMITGIALLAGLNGHVRACWIFNLLAVGVFVVGFSVMRATTAIVGALAPTPESMQPARWLQRVQSLAPIVQDDLRASLERLSETVRHAGSNPVGTAAAENESIDAGLSRLSAAIASNNSPQTLAELHQLGTLMAQREASLKLLRTRA